MTLNVVVVDDSEVCRISLREILEADRDIKVVGEAAEPESAFQMIARLKPNVATVDIQMPGIGGLELIGRIMAAHPLPILVVTGLPAGPNSDLVFQALRRGALEVAEKPAGNQGRAAGLLRESVRLLSRVSVVKHIAGSKLSAGAAVASPSRSPKPQTAGPQLSAQRRIRVIGIGASAGGPQAVAAVLGALPADLPSCVALVQHIPNGFADPLATFLRGVSNLRVQVVREPTQPAQGTLLVASDDCHLVADSSGSFVAVRTPPISGHRPSVTVLFSSLAAVFGPAAVGVVLTGIGDDGAAGLAEMRNAGAITIAQNQASSAVYGMPKAAVEMGGASSVLPLDQIGPEIVRVVTRSQGNGPATKGGAR